MFSKRNFDPYGSDYLDAMARLAKALASYSPQSVQEWIEDDLIMFDLRLYIELKHPEFHTQLMELPPDQCLDDKLLQEFEAEIIFGNAKGAAAGKQALEAEGFILELRPGYGHRMMAYGACPADADTPRIVRELEALIKPHGGMIQELMPTRDLEQPGRGND